MGNYQIKQLTRRGEEHRDFCEDSSLHYKIDDFVFSIVLDGCSSGTESHFASSLFKRIFYSILSNTRNTSADKEVSVYYLMEQFYAQLQEVVLMLNLRSDMILSTIVLSCTNVKDKTAFAIIAGDGLISIDGKTMVNIEPENNAPDYIAYHLNKSLYDIWEKHIFKYEFTNIEKTISVCSDGICSFKSKQKLEEDFEYNYLLVDDRFINNENMLSRKCKILNNQHDTFHGDDLSIIRIDFKQTENEDL